MRAWIFTATILALLVPEPGLAQGCGSLEPGDLVYVERDGANAVSGRLVGGTGSELQIEDSISGTRVRVPVRDARGVFEQCHGDPVIDGALAGAGVGASVGVLGYLGAAVSVAGVFGGEPEYRADGIVLSGVVGAAIGGSLGLIFDAIDTGTRWVRVTHLGSEGPGGEGSTGIGLSVLLW